MGPGGRFYQPRPQRMAPNYMYGAPSGAMRGSPIRQNSPYPPRMMRMPLSRSGHPPRPGGGGGGGGVIVGGPAPTPLFRHPMGHAYPPRPNMNSTPRSTSASITTSSNINSSISSSTRPGFNTSNISPNGKSWSPAHLNAAGKGGATHVVFDMTHCESYFPRAAPATLNEEEKAFTDLLLHRHSEISLPQNHLTFITTLVSQFAAIIDQLVVNPSAFESAKVIEVRPVGAFKGQSLMRDQCEAELVLVLQTLPTRLAVDGLGDYCAEQLQMEYGSTHYGCMRLRIASESREYGFDIAVIDLDAIEENNGITRPTACLFVHVCTTPNNMANLDPDLHVSALLQQKALMQLRRSRWFEENATHTSIRVLIRLLKDIALRFDGMHHLTPWMVDLLAHYTIMNNSEGQPLPINIAFRRVFQLLATGLFLPGSAGIIDPCQQPMALNGALPRVHYQLSPEEQDELCCAAQTLLRILTHHGYRYILQAELIPGLPPDPQTTNIIKEVSLWNGILVAPSEKVVSLCTEVEGNEEAEQTTSQSAVVAVAPASIVGGGGGGSGNAGVGGAVPTGGVPGSVAVH